MARKLSALLWACGLYPGKVLVERAAMLWVFLTARSLPLEAGLGAALGFSPTCLGEGLAKR